MPLNFSSMLDELNVVSMLALLNFLHCYRIPLHQKTGRGAWQVRPAGHRAYTSSVELTHCMQTIRYLVLGAYVSSADGSQPLLSTAGMCAAEVPQIAELINIPLHLERQHPSLPVKIGEVDPVSEEIVEKLVEVFKSTGEVLQEGGYPDLGSFVAQALKDGKGDADYLVEKLVRAFPAFRDMYLIQDQRAWSVFSAHVPEFDLCSRPVQASTSSKRRSSSSSPSIRLLPKPIDPLRRSRFPSSPTSQSSRTTSSRREPRFCFIRHSRGADSTRTG